MDNITKPIKTKIKKQYKSVLKFSEMSDIHTLKNRLRAKYERCTNNQNNTHKMMSIIGRNFNCKEAKI